MPITRQKKEEILKELEGDFKDSKIIIFVNFHGLGVSLTNKLRRLLREINAKYLVAKKTLIKKALGSVNLLENVPKMEGEIALVVSKDDPLAPAKILDKFIKENKLLAFIGGVYDGKYIDSKTIKEIASIPSREILFGKLVYVIVSPQRGLVVTLNGVIRNLVGVLSQIAASDKSAAANK